MRKVEPYTVVTRDGAGVEAVSVGVRAPNADIAIRRAKETRDGREHAGIRAYSTVAVYPGVAAPLIRSALVAVLTTHRRIDAARCSCGADGWGDTAAEHAEHVAAAYERVARASTAGADLASPTPLDPNERLNRLAATASDAWGGLPLSVRYAAARAADELVATWHGGGGDVGH